ncbi:CU044_2847 family protein [Dactylosporangium sp. NPDC000244]|uniref:CU044_2847 family protein n=1 Tax=Dactylosporangium sp. NPDC000244 TaxID=3154365 RepID=UPI0033175188
MAVGRMPIGDGTADFIEIEVSPRDLDEAVSLVSVQDAVMMLPYTLAGSMDSVMPALNYVVRRLKEHRPDELELQLGLKVGGGCGLIVAKGTAEATFNVKMTWKKPAPESES